MGESDIVVTRLGAMAIFTVVGAGMMGSALCVPLVDRGHEVRLVGTHLDADIVAALRDRNHHPKLRHDLPEAIEVFPHTALSEAMDGAEVLALGVSSAGVTWACEQLKPFASRPTFMITKGLVGKDAGLQIIPDVVGEALGGHPAAIAGPCIAGELARRVPTCVVVTGRAPALCRELAALLRTPYYHVSTSEDAVGTEVCAALKNAFAMGVAFGAGMHAASGGEPGSIAMHNVESAVFAQAVVEMRRVIGRLGGDPLTAAGLAGAGDLDVTNNGGRTGRFGRFLGRGLSRDEAIERMEGATLECLGILAVMRPAVRAWKAEEELPLLVHLMEVGLDGAPVALPFERFFGGATG